MPSFGWRLGLLLTVGVVVVLVDLRRHGARATKWREYSYLLLGGLIGAALGGANDRFVTSVISPDYFTIGKGIPAGEAFSSRVLLLGLQAGFAPGLLVAGLFLYLNSRKSPAPPLSGRTMLRLLLLPVLGAVVCAIVIPGLASGWDPLDFHRALGRLLGEQRARHFLLVWWIHLSLYLGALLGLVAGIQVLTNLRRRFVNT